MAAGFKEQRGAAAAVDPAQLPPEQQLPQIMQLLSDSILVRHTTSTRGLHSAHQQQQLLQQRQKQEQEQLTFARLAHDFVSPRKMPTHSGAQAAKQPVTTGRQ